MDSRACRRLYRDLLSQKRVFSSPIGSSRHCSSASRTVLPHFSKKYRTWGIEKNCEGSVCVFRRKSGGCSMGLTSFYLIFSASPIGYPDHLSQSAWMCFMATIQSATITFLLKPNLEAWNFSYGLEPGCCLFSGIVGSGISFVVQAWCISKRGPLFSAMFNPLCTYIVTILAALFLNEKIYTGGLIGAIGVVIGLYILLWGKAKDTAENKEEIRNPKLQNSTDKKQVVDVLEKDCCKINLEEPLLSHQSFIGSSERYKS